MGFVGGGVPLDFVWSGPSCRVSCSTRPCMASPPGRESRCRMVGARSTLPVGEATVADCLKAGPQSEEDVAGLMGAHGAVLSATGAEAGGEGVAPRIAGVAGVWSPNGRTWRELGARGPSRPTTAGWQGAGDVASGSRRQGALRTSPGTSATAASWLGGVACCE